MPIETRTITVYNPDACAAPLVGCMAEDALNYDPAATEGSGLCEWGNDPASAVYTKNDCPAGQTGKPITLSVAANEYIAKESELGVLASKAKANEFRDDDMPIRGQFLANSQENGCIPPDPEEEGTIELLRVEYQRSLVVGEGFTRPPMVRALLVRSSVNGASAVSGNVFIHSGAPAGLVVETFPGYTIPEDGDCDTTQTTAGFSEGGSFYASFSVDQDNYEIALPGYVSVNFVDDFSPDMICT